MRKSIVLFAVKYAAIFAGGGLLLRIIFFQSWLSVVNTFFILYLAWMLCIMITLMVLRHYFKELYDLLIPPIKKEVEATNEELLGKMLDIDAKKKKASITTTPTGSKDDIDPNEIFDTATSKKDDAKNALPEEAYAFNFKGPRRADPNKMSSKELEEIKRFDSKDIAKAVRLMIGPEEDNPLNKDNNNK
ncbi:hypothetical protein COTS27_00781 [Spirochaetota bacterium]|nr:hypothetical protein COTS27_00781 [Spirochaetota bacterium]